MKSNEIKNVLMSGGAIGPCSMQPDGSKTHYECLRSGINVGKRLAQQETAPRRQRIRRTVENIPDVEEGTFTEETVPRQKIRRTVERIPDVKEGTFTEETMPSKQKKKDLLAKAAAARKREGERVEQSFRLGREIEKEKGEEKQKSQKEFAKKQEKLASELSRIQEKKSGRVPIEDATNDVLKGLLQKKGVTGYRNMNRAEVINRLREMNINFVKAEGSGVMAYKSLKGRGCMSCM